MTMLELNHARVAYDAFATHYDLFTAHHDYDLWTRTLERLARDHGLSGNRLLDVACGTGKSFVPFLERGYEVTACDISAAMVEQAAQKAGDRARLEVHDMRTLPRLGEYDLVCCLDDAVNYLLTARELGAALTRMAHNLAPGGVLLFDVNTVRSYRTFYGSLSVIPSEDTVIVWNGHAQAEFGEAHLASATAEILERTGDDEWARHEAVHHQCHHPRRVVEAALSRAGLACTGVYGMQLDGSMEPGFDEHGNSKAVYVARRAEDA
ncbi:MAG TPA: class I SAM-dependent methyltransferase [Solirubrobacteraceae bacterium]